MFKPESDNGRTCGHWRERFPALLPPFLAPCTRVVTDQEMNVAGTQAAELPAPAMPRRGPMARAVS